jgi:glycosylphosphatidylinositol deacylase
MARCRSAADDLLLACSADNVFVMLRSLLLLLWAVCLAAQDAGVPGGCRMAYMSPRYIHVNGMDGRHSRLASKYTLHLYREGGWDEDPVAGVSCRRSLPT